MKKFIFIIISVVLCACCFSVTTNAKVIEPEIVKTETWTTSYYIDDDIETLYPYVRCEADIYNDGTIDISLYNTHEFDTFSTNNVFHRFTVCSMGPHINQGDMDLDNFDQGYMPKAYDCFDMVDYFHYSGWSDGLYEYARDASRNRCSPDALIYYLGEKYDKSEFDEYLYGFDYDYCYNGYNGSMARTEYDYYMYSDPVVLKCHFTDLTYNKVMAHFFIIPNTVVPSDDDYWENYSNTESYDFRLFGHDITITPELLSGNIIAEPELTEQEKYIQKLEQENAELKNQLSSIDCDLDGLLTCSDAQMILTYYVDSLANGTSGKIEDYPEYLCSRYYF